MSISALTSEAARLLAYFQGAESDIQSKINTALQAAGFPGKTYHVDSILGSDANSGTTSADPFATLHKALALVTGGSNSRNALIKLARESQFTLDADYFLMGSHLSIEAYDPGDGRTGRPAIQQSAIALGDPADRIPGLTMLGGSVRIDNVDVSTAANTVGTSIIGMFRSRLRSGHGSVSFSNSIATLNEAPLSVSEASLCGVSLYNCDVLKPGSAPLCSVGNSGSGASTLALSISGVTIPIGAVWPDDLITGILRSPGGAPRNVISNLDLSA